MSMHSDGSGPLFYARFSDGRTASSIDVDVRLGAKGVEILRRGSTTLFWPYETIAAAEPLTDHAIDALLSSPATPGAALFVGEGTFARRLARLAPHLSARAQRWRHARPWLAGTALLVLVAGSVWALDLSPSRAIASFLPDKARALLGEQVIEDMTSGLRTCDAPDGRAALDRLIARLSRAAGGGTTFKVVVSDWGLLNAFAAPGEQIVMTRGLIEKAQSGDEIAGVLAHEMGHGLERHPETAIVRALGLTAGLELMMGGSGGTLANAGLLLAQLSYSREAEREADGHALAILKSAGIAHKGLADFFRRIMKIEGETKLGEALSKIEVLRTHPDTAGRMAAVEHAPTYAATAAMSSSDWEALKDICKSAKPRAGGKDGEGGRSRPSPDDSEKDI